MRFILIVILISMIIGCNNSNYENELLKNELIENNEAILKRIKSIHNFDSSLVNRTYYPVKIKQLRETTEKLIYRIENGNFTIETLKDTIANYQSYVTMQVLNGYQVDEIKLIEELNSYFSFKQRITVAGNITDLICINKLLICELMVTEHLNNAVYAGNFDFNWLNMTVIPNNDHIKLGDKFSADIVIRTFDTLNIAPICVYSKVKSNDEIQYGHNIDDPLIKLVNYDKQDTLFYDNINKLYHYECIADKKGENKIVGYITIKQPVTGAKLFFPFKQTYIVE